MDEWRRYRSPGLAIHIGRSPNDGPDSGPGESEPGEELNFAFWQYTAPDDPEVGCSAIPPAGATPEQMLAFLEIHSSTDVLAGEGSLDFSWQDGQCGYSIGSSRVRVMSDC